METDRVPRMMQNMNRIVEAIRKLAKGKNDARVSLYKVCLKVNLHPVTVKNYVGMIENSASDITFDNIKNEFVVTKAEG